MAVSASSFRVYTTIIRPNPGNGTHRLMWPYVAKWVRRTSRSNGWKNSFGIEVTAKVFVLCMSIGEEGDAEPESEMRYVGDMEKEQRTLRLDLTSS